MRNGWTDRERCRRGREAHGCSSLKNCCVSDCQAVPVEYAEARRPLGNWLSSTLTEDDDMQDGRSSAVQIARSLYHCKKDMQQGRLRLSACHELSSTCSRVAPVSLQRPALLCLIIAHINVLRIRVVHLNGNGAHM